MEVLVMFDQQRYKQTFEKESYDQIRIIIRKEKDVKNRLKLLSIGLNKSVNQLINEAIDDLLNKYNA